MNYLNTTIAIFFMLQLPIAAQAGTIRARCMAGPTGTDVGFVYGDSEAELRDECNKIAYEGKVSDRAPYPCNPKNKACSEYPAVRNGNRIAISAQIPKSKTANIHSPACGDGHWSKCKTLCLEAPPNTRLDAKMIQISSGHGIGCLPFDKLNHYVTCDLKDGDCGSYSGLEGVSMQEAKFCATGKNWSDSSYRCFRIEAEVIPSPLRINQ